MFKFRRKKGLIPCVAPISGDLIPITKVPDDVFAQKMMGDGYAVNPQSNVIVAPISGETTTIFPTKHAIGFKNDSGTELLLHLGLDTVTLNGAPFEIDVTVGQKLQAGEPIGRMDRSEITSAGKDSVVIVIFTKMDADRKLIMEAPGLVTQGQHVGDLE